MRYINLFLSTMVMVLSCVVGVLLLVLVEDEQHHQAKISFLHNL